MEITLDSKIRIQNIQKQIMEQIKTDLTIDNPEYAMKLRMGIPVWGVQKKIKLWEQDGVQFILPRGYYARLYKMLKDRNIKFEINDNRILLFPEIEYPAYPKLRDYQKPAINQAMSWSQGCLIMPCGSGKTEVGMAIAANLKQPTLWITHTMDLLKQSMDRAISRLKLTGDMVGLIQGKNMKIGSHMTFATVQTLAKRDLTNIKNKFGCIIVDEAHLVFKDAAKTRTFESVISQFPAYCRFGLTASEHRSDGLINTMFHIIGSKIYEIEQDDSRLKTVKPEVHFINTYFNFEMGTELKYNSVTGEMEEKKEMLNVQQLYQAMRDDTLRDSMILNILAEQKQGDSTLVLGHSLEHLENLMNKTKKHFGTKYECRFVNGSTKKKERDKAIEDMREGRAHFLFATYQLAKLGLDIPRLNRLVLATPVKDKTSIQQAVGRTMRPFEGKGTPVVYDIWDKNIKQMQYWARERVKMYRNLGCEIIGGPNVRQRSA